MNETTEPIFTFRKSRFTKRWAAFGPAEHLEVSKVIKVMRNDETHAYKRVTSVSKPFDVAGVQFAYGHVTYNDFCPRCRDGEIPAGQSTALCSICSLEDLGLL